MSLEDRAQLTESLKLALAGPVYVRWTVEDEAGQVLWVSGRTRVAEGNSYQITPSKLEVTEI